MPLRLNGTHCIQLAAPSKYQLALAISAQPRRARPNCITLVVHIPSGPKHPSHQVTDLNKIYRQRRPPSAKLAELRSADEWSAAAPDVMRYLDSIELVVEEQRRRGFSCRVVAGLATPLVQPASDAPHG